MKKRYDEPFVKLAALTGLALVLLAWFGVMRRWGYL